MRKVQTQSRPRTIIKEEPAVEPVKAEVKHEAQAISRFGQKAEESEGWAGPNARGWDKAGASHTGARRSPSPDLRATDARPVDEQQRSDGRNAAKVEPRYEPRYEPIITSYELESLKLKLLGFERDLVDERSLRRKSEENASNLTESYERKLREATDGGLEKSRDAVRRAKSEAEEELKDRVRVVERKHAEELESMKSTLQSERKRVEDLRLELEASRKKLELTREEIRVESSSEVDRVKGLLSDAEDKVMTQAKELKKLREEYTSMATKLATALQMSSVAQAEMEGLRVATATSSAEAQTTHAALVQATQRMQQLDSEIVSLRAESYLIKQENESSLNELRKVRLSSVSTGDRAQVVESEIKRKNTQLQVIMMNIFYFYSLRQIKVYNYHDIT
jgi:DNA repair exonuclease SbcCD ATPase subunit